MNDRDPFGRDDHLGDPSLPDGPVPEDLERMPIPPHPFDGGGMTAEAPAPPPSVALLATRDAIAAGYTELAEWADRHPDVSLHPSGATIYAFAPDRATFTAWTRALADGAPLAAVRKDISDTYATAVRRFGAVDVQVTIARIEVCERVVTGTRTVEVPDPEVVAAAPLVTIDEEIVEWRCPPSFLAEG